MFKEVDPKASFIELEHRILAFWKEHDCFDKLREKNRGKERWSFLDGPITANNPMGVHHAWGRTYKDIFQRYHAMLGHDQRYQNGFDCQGLWVEVEVEKELGFKSKRDIEAYGIAEFVEKCKERVRKYSGDPDRPVDPARLLDGLGQLLLHDVRREQLHDLAFPQEVPRARLDLQGRRRDALVPALRHGASRARDRHRGLPGAEAPEHHRALPASRSGPDESLLVWTTTPWTLTVQRGRRRASRLTYVKVKQGDEIFYLAEARQDDAARGELEVLDELPGQRPGRAGRTTAVRRSRGRSRPSAHRVIAWDEVSRRRRHRHRAHRARAAARRTSRSARRRAWPPSRRSTRRASTSRASAGSRAGTSAEVTDDDPRRPRRSAASSTGRRPYTHRYPVCWRCRRSWSSAWWTSGSSPWTSCGDEIKDVARQDPLDPGVRPGPRARLARTTCTTGDLARSATGAWRCRSIECAVRPLRRDRQRGRAEGAGRRGLGRVRGPLPAPALDRRGQDRLREVRREVARIEDVGNPWLDAGIVPFSTMDYRTDRAYWEKWFPPTSSPSASRASSATGSTRCWP